MASRTLAGLSLHDGLESLPDATTTGIPWLITFWTAASTAALAEPPMLRLTTLGRPGVRLAKIQLSADTSVDILAPPLQSNIRTGINRTALATPYCDPPIIPAT